MKLIKAEIFGGNIIRHFYVTFNGVWKPCMSSKYKRKSSKIQTNIKTLYSFVCSANIVYLLHHLQFHKRICTFYTNWLEPDEKKTHLWCIFSHFGLQQLKDDSSDENWPRWEDGRWGDGSLKSPRDFHFYNKKYVAAYLNIWKVIQGLMVCL